MSENNPEIGSASTDDVKPDQALLQADVKTSEASVISKTEVSRVIQDRLAKEKKKFLSRLDEERELAIADFRAEHGLDDDVLSELGKKDQTAVEFRNLKRAKTIAERERDDIRARHEVVLQKLTGALTRDAVLRASVGKAVDPEQVWYNLQDSVKVDDDFSVITLENGEPSSKSIGDLVDDLLTRKKFLALPTTSFNGAGSKPSERIESKGEDKKTLTKDGRREILKKLEG